MGVVNLRLVSASCLQPLQQPQLEQTQLGGRTRYEESLENRAADDDDARNELDNVDEDVDNAVHDEDEGEALGALRRLCWGGTCFFCILR